MGEVIKLHDTKNITILALDQGTTTGWAYGVKDSEFGSKTFNDEINVQRWISYCKWLDQKVKSVAPVALVTEKPFFRGRSSDYLVAFANMSKVVAHKNEVAHLEVHGMTIKRHAGVSKGKLTKQALAKGWNVKNDHEADALFLLDFVRKNGEISYGN